MAKREDFRRVASMFRHGGATLLAKAPRLAEDDAAYFRDELRFAIGKVAAGQRHDETVDGVGMLTKALSPGMADAALAMARAVASAFLAALSYEGKRLADGAVVDGSPEDRLRISSVMLALEAIGHGAATAAGTIPNHAPPSLAAIDSIDLPVVRADALARIVMGTVPNRLPAKPDGFWELRHRNRQGRLVEDIVGRHLAAALAGGPVAVPDVQAAIAEREAAVAPDPEPGEEFVSDAAKAAIGLVDDAAAAFDFLRSGVEITPKGLLAALPGGGDQARAAALRQACRDALMSFGRDIDSPNEKRGRTKAMLVGHLQVLVWGAVELIHSFAAKPREATSADLERVANIVVAIADLPYGAGAARSAGTGRKEMTFGNDTVNVPLKLYKTHHVRAGGLAVALADVFPKPDGHSPLVKATRARPKRPVWHPEEYRRRMRRPGRRTT